MVNNVDFNNNNNRSSIPKSEVEYLFNNNDLFIINGRIGEKKEKILSPASETLLQANEKKEVVIIEKPQLNREKEFRAINGIIFNFYFKIFTKSFEQWISPEQKKNVLNSKGINPKIEFEKQSKTVCVTFYC